MSDRAPTPGGAAAEQPARPRTAGFAPPAGATFTTLTLQRQGSEGGLLPTLPARALHDRRVR